MLHWKNCPHCKATNYFLDSSLKVNQENEKECLEELNKYNEYKKDPSLLLNLTASPKKTEASNRSID
jgi:glutaredoxin